MQLKSKIFTGWMGVVLLFVVVAFVTFFIARSESVNGVMIIAALIGVGIAVASFKNPEFGFYFATFFSFIAFDLNRLVYSSVSFISLIDVLVLIIFLAIMLRKLQNGESFWENCKHPIVYGYLIYAGFTLTQIFNPNANSVALSASIVRKFFNLLLILYCALELFRTQKQMYRFIHVWMFMAFLCGFYGCYQQWFGYPDYELNHIMSDPRLIALYTLPTGDLRKFGTISDPRNFGLLMAACGLISTIFVLQVGKTVKQKALYAMYTIIFGLALSYSGTRTAVLMLIMGLVLYTMLTLLNKTTIVFTGIAALALLFVLYGPIYGNPTINRLRTAFDFEKDESLNVRDMNRQRMQPYMHAHPMGGGLGTTGDDNIESNFAHPLAGFPPDSGYLLTGLEAGWIGLALQMMLYFLVLQQGIKTYFRTGKKNRKILLACIVALFGYMVAQYAQVSIGQPPGLFLFYGAIAIIANAVRLDPDDASVPTL